MNKLPVLLLIAGLAIGLWLGFNPTTHRELVGFWNSATKTDQAHARPVAALNIRQLDQKVAVWFRTTTRVQVTPQSRPTALPIWKQISAALQTFWNAMQRFLASIISRPVKAGTKGAAQ